MINDDAMLQELLPEALRPVGEPQPPVPPSSYVDKLGRVYPVDSYGHIIRKTCRPFGVTVDMWKKASKKQKKEIVEAFEGVPPNVELAEKWATMTRDERAAARR
eukprot:9981063-Lingulodinium_polyedra.AAC.1